MKSCHHSEYLTVFACQGLGRTFFYLLRTLINVDFTEISSFRKTRRHATQSREVDDDVHSQRCQEGQRMPRSRHGTGLGENCRKRTTTVYKDNPRGWGRLLIPPIIKGSCQGQVKVTRVRSQPETLRRYDRYCVKVHYVVAGGMLPVHTPTRVGKWLEARRPFACMYTPSNPPTSSIRSTQNIHHKLEECSYSSIFCYQVFFCLL